MYTLKSIAQRGTLLGAAVALVAAAVMPSAAVFADALNPLTERSLLLSSSAPGFQDTDGSGNSAGGPENTSTPNAIGENYAPAGSGPNGMKTGETFSFKVSSDSTTRAIKAFTLQYCTTAAGLCQAPGNNTGDARTTREANIDAHPNSRSDFDVVGAWTEGAGAGQYQVTVNGSLSSGWTLAATNEEDDAHLDALTGKMNYLTLTNATTGATPAPGQKVEITFNPSETTYITNPGSGAFFVKINTYDSELTANHVPLGASNIDGGVTVANVMTDSIHITTKVLETMAFSVGTHNRDTDEQVLPAKNGTCDAIQKLNNNRLELGNPSAEYSLETGRAWDTHSYWRLSSNSSGGATVYYSGDTLKNTIGDEIAAIGATANLSNPGQEQFGLAFVDDSEMVAEVSNSFAALVADGNEPHKNPSILPLEKEAPYANGSGPIWVGADEMNPETITGAFAFDTNSLMTPTLIAQNTTDGGVLSCATGKMRYVGNIAADTPAGVYTTKINYLAAPQY